MTRRKDPVYPAIVVGKPPMEDKFLGDATQQMLGPLIRLIHKEIRSLWAYYEAGFHNLLAVGIEQRYQKEAMKAALGLMGTDQLSLTKCMIAVSAGVDVRSWHAVLREIRENFNPHYDFVMIPKVPLDTLDFTSYKMNLGSKMIIDATRKPWRTAATPVAGTPLACDVNQVRRLDSRIGDAVLVDETLLIVKLARDPADDGSAGKQVLEKILRYPPLARLPVAAIVSHDVDVRNAESYIWGIFTRFDCERDILFAETSLIGISPVYRGTMGIDATWKPGYPKPLTMTDEIVKRVDDKWGKIWKR
jgi:3-polyprenyl-4-hydroxybenzoate decarboxylase